MMGIRGNLKKMVAAHFVEIMAPPEADAHFDEESVEAAPIGAQSETEVEEPEPMLNMAEPPTVKDFNLTIDLQKIVGPTGAVSFDKLFAAAALPDASISAEQGAWIISMLPEDQAIRVRRTSAKGSLEALSKFDSEAALAAVAQIVNDAALKALCVDKLLRDLVARSESEHNRIDREIAMLEAEISMRRTALVDLERSTEVAQEACLFRRGKFNEVVQFFDHADFAQDGETLSTLNLSAPAVPQASGDAPLRMVAGARG